MGEQSVKQLDEYLTCRQAAEQLGVPKQRVLNWAVRGVFGKLEKQPTGRGGRPQYMIPREAVAQIAVDLKNQPQKPKRQGGGQLKADDGPAELDNDGMLTKLEVLELTGWSESHLYKLTSTGRLEVIQVRDPASQDYVRLWSRNSIEAYLANRRTHKAQAAAPKSTALELVARLEVNLRELKYALIREDKSRKKELAAKLQRLLDE